MSDAVPGAALLPIASWELAKERKVLPVDIQRMIGVHLPYVRVRPTIDLKIRTKHRSIVPAYEEFETVIGRWQFARVSGEQNEKWEIYVEWDEEWILIVIGRDREDGFFNLISMYSRRHSAAERVRAGNVIERKK